MSLNKKFLLKSLLQYNYFPSQKKEKEEIPPILSSKCLTPKISEKLIDLDYRKGGYDQVEYRVARYNNVPRCLSIPHPLAYANLCHSLHDYWGKLEYITQTENSLLIPQKHGDGRIIIMNYGNTNTEENIERHIELSFNKKFYIETDISNFYPSIYSHSIPWALVGFETAKKERDPKKWFNKIDTYQRLIKRNETNGIPIGPATSNIISELILARIDEILKDEGFVFIRYIDDYTAYFNTYEKAEEFIRRLSEELSKYKLLLNIKKTSIKQLPFPSSPEWIIDLITRIPDKDNISPINMIRFLEYALNKQAVSPDDSILKYAIKTIIYNVKNETAKLLLQYTLNLCITYPILIPLLYTLFEKINFDSEDLDLITEQLLNIVDEHAINKRSDAMTWVLYYLNKFSQPIPEETAKKIIKSEDCIAILFLYLSNQYDEKIVTFCDGLDKSDLFLLDQYWLLLYQLFFDGKITNPYQDKKAYTNHLKSNNDTEENAMKREIQVFNTLKRDNVSFIDSR